MAASRTKARGAPLTAAATLALVLAALDLAWLNLVLAPEVLESEPATAAAVAVAVEQPATATPAAAAAESASSTSTMEIEASDAGPCDRDGDEAAVRVYFERASAEVSPQAARRIEEIASRVAGLGDDVLLIDGHADRRGPEEQNEVLSQERAGAVAERAREAGVPDSRLRVRHFGERFPLASDAPDTRWRNRRVTLCLSNRSAAR